MKRITFLFTLFFLAIIICYAQSTDEEKYEQANNYYEAKEYEKAFPILRELADKNHAKALNLLGVFYNYGYIVPKNMQKAVELYQKSANLGWRGAQRNIGICYERGEGVLKDVEKAYLWYEKAFRQYMDFAKKGDAYAQLEVGIIYFEGRIRSGKDYSKALPWFEKSANQGNAIAANYLGIMYQYSYGVEKDINKAYDFYSKAAENGNPFAMSNLGWLYLNDEYQEKHPSTDPLYYYGQAEIWYKKSAQKNCSEGYYGLASLYLDYPDDNVIERLEKSLPYFEKAAMLNHGLAQIAVGYSDMRNLDYHSALEWFNRAKRNGCKGNLGLLTDTWITVCNFFIKNPQYSFYWDFDCCSYSHQIYEEKDCIYVGALLNNKFGFLSLSKTGNVLGQTQFIYESFDDSGEPVSPGYDEESKLFHVFYNGNEITLDSASIIQESNNLNKDLPSIKWLEFVATTTNKECPIKLGVESKSKIENVTISVNGIQDRGIKTLNNSDYDLTINRTLTLNEGTNVIKVSVRNAAGTTQEEKTIVYRPQGRELPTIEWLDFAATAIKKEYQMKLGIKSKSKVEEVNVTVNGAQSRGIKPVPADGYDLTVDRILALSEGVNRIVVSVRNGDGISTSEKVITYQGINPTPIFNDKRIAFVVGNSHYSNSEMNLTNPENDAKDVAEKLKGLGFEVILKLDATLETMDKELSSFKDKAKDYDVAMFYYAGHGIQNKGVNYIIPTNIQNLAEDNLKYKCVNMERVLDVMEDSQCKLKIVILDACRNDPVSRKWHRSAGTRGLSIMNAPIGTIISFSTSPGSTALDGTGRNSPYTQAFLNTLDMPNLDVFHFFQKVGASVLDMTQKAQNPWLSVSFTGDFYFNKQ